MMTIPAPFQGRIQTVEAQWADYNGHLNMAYYHVLFDRAGDEAFSAIGLGPNYVTQRNATFFTVEAHVSYLAELKPGDKVRVTTQILDHDAKRVHYVQQMFHADDGYLACVTENMVMHVSMETRRSAPFPADIQARIDEMATAHKGLAIPPQVGHRIGIPRK